MRIIAGEFRGRKIRGPEGARLRPTADRLRESIFNVVIHRFEGSLTGLRVADLFAGTGAYGLEALSRGAAEAVFIENHPDAWRLLEENIALLGVKDRARVLKTDALALSQAGAPFDVVFLDPPYARGLIEPALAALTDKGLAGPGTLAVVERGEEESFDLPTQAEEARVIRQGKRYAHFLLYK